MENNGNHKFIHHPGVNEIVIYPPTSLLQGPEEVDTHRKEAINKVQAQIIDRFNAGLPTFTSNSIETLGKQLKTLDNDDPRVYVQDLEGKLVHFEVETGKVMRAGERGLVSIFDRVVTAPFIAYSTPQHFATDKSIVPGLAHCHLRIMHWTYVRDIVSKELLKPLTRSYEDVAQSFKATQSALNANAVCEELEAILHCKLPRCEKVIGFCLGPMPQPVNEAWKNAPAYQHALLLALHELLTRHQGYSAEVDIFAQDSAYTEVDQLVLRNHGIAVLEDPEGLLQVDDNCAVFSCAPNVPVRQIVSDLSWPAIMMWLAPRTIESYTS